MMGDSDDEYDRKRRDKFRGERSAGSEGYRTERRDERRPGLTGSSGGREDWAERNPFRGAGGGGGGGGRPPRPEYRDYRAPRDRYTSPGREMPPTKRMRPDWAEDMRGGMPRYGYDPYLMHAWNEHYAHSVHGGYGHPGGGAANHAAHSRETAAASGDLQTQPPLMTLKQFLDTQDDGISDAEVLRKYSEYKLEFKRQQLNEFFVAHKDEEWFKNKYHPVDSVNRKEEQLSFLKKRVEVFNELLQSGNIKSVTVDTLQTEPLLRLLDTVVIKLEGGTDDDLKILDEKPKDLMQFSERTFQRRNQDHDDDVIITSVEKKVPEIEREEREELPRVVSPPPTRRLLTSDDDENWDEGETDSPEKTKQEITTKKDSLEDDDSGRESRDKKTTKRKRADSDSSSSSSNDSDSTSSSSSEDEDEENRDKYNVEDVKLDDKEENDDDDDDEEDDEKSVEPDKLESQESKEGSTANGDIEAMETDKQKDENNAIGEQIIASPKQPESETDAKNSVENYTEDIKSEIDKDNEAQDEAGSITTADVANGKSNNVDASNGDDTANTEKDDDKATDQPETIDLDKVKDGPQPRALHRTSSIFLRNLAPSITKAEIEAICKNFDGYLRVAIADPLVERRWYRRGWVTFKRDVNIKEICWNLNNTRLRDCEMGAIVNRDLSRRVRPVNGMTAHKTIVRSDIKLCAKIALNMDDKFKLWDETNANTIAESSKANGDSSKSYGFHSNNPVLQNITDFLIEEASAEEEELLGLARESKDADGEIIERDPQLISVLDSLILYLRIVHSVDFYNHCEYPYEDEMPNRCGIIHARGPTAARIATNDIQDYTKSFETKMQQFLAKTTTIEGEELKNLGAKDTEAEVEKFIQANSQELAKDKWLCPLSGKKFKGPEFIRKHIFNKHLEKVDEVRKEVEFFNNYLRDPKRPQLPEHPGSTKRTNSESSTGANTTGYRQPAYPPPYPPPYAYAPPMMMPGRGGGRSFGGGRRPGGGYFEHRQFMHYRDLDAPQD